MNELKTLSDIFENIILRIPDYQRGYSWEKPQLEDLWNDLSNINTFVDNSYHFTGILTVDECSEQNYLKLSEEGFNVKGNKIEINELEYIAYNIVDGQQRLTTILILISLLISALEDANEIEKDILLNKYISIQTTDDFLFVFGYEKDIPSHQYLIGEIFDNPNIQITEPETIYTKNLSNTKRFLLEKITSLDNNQRGILLKKLTERLLFYVFKIEKDKLDMSLVFETLNYRGKQLSKLELFKNRLIFLVTKRYVNDQQSNLRTEIINTWQVIYEWLGKNEKNKLNDDDFLRAFWIMFYKHDDKKEKDLKKYETDLFNNKFPIQNIRDNENISLRQIEKLLLNLQKAIKCWFFIHNPYFNTDNTELEYCDILKEHADLISKNPTGSHLKILMMACLIKNNKQEIEEEEENLLIDIFKAIEKHNYCVYLLNGKKADTNRAQIYRVVNKYFRGSKPSYSLLEFINRHTIEHQNFDNIFNHIHNNRQKNEKFHDWNGLKYTLYCYDKSLDSNNKIENYTTADKFLIFPDQYGYGVQFPNVTRSRYGDNVQTLKFSLGNITITNKKLKSQNFSSLRQSLSEGSNSDKEISEFDDWTDETILFRGLKILSFIEENWSIRIGDKNQKRKLLIENLNINLTNNSR